MRHTKTTNQSGQTLIETIVAIFILTTALTAALALTIYVYANSGRSINQTIAVNLAQEAIDVVRNMRDTNWLESDAQGGNWALSDCNVNSIITKCFPRTWEGVPGNGYHHYDLSLGNTYLAAYYALSFNSMNNTWNLVQGPSDYWLYLGADGSYTTTNSGNPVYARKLIFNYITSAPFGSGSAAELMVTSIVGWKGRGCTDMTNSDPSTTNCSVSVTESLTNWKDYR